MNTSDDVVTTHARQGSRRKPTPEIEEELSKQSKEVC